MVPKTSPRADSWLDPVLGATAAFVLPSFCPALQSIALCIRTGCALAKNRFAAMGLVDNGCLCGSHSHLPLGWLIWGMHLCCFLMGWGHSSFSIIYAGRGATSDEHFSFFVRKNIRFVGLFSGTNSGPVLDPRGPKQGPFSGPEHGPRKFMVLVCHC